MNRDKKIFLDVDGVLADFNQHFLDYLGFEDKSPAKSWDDPRFTENMHKIANDVKFWTTIPPIVPPQAVNFPVHGYCTARPIPSKITRHWLVTYGFPEAPVYTVGLGGSKVDILEQQGVDIFVDDAIHNFEEINAAGIRCFLMTRSHNLMYDTPLRVDNLEDFSVRAKPTYLILGHKEHGKTTLAEYLKDLYDLEFSDSSMAAAKIFIFDKLKDKYGYQSFEECFIDRRNKRSEWFNLIADYNRENETKLAETILKENNIYVGMRRAKEIEKCKEKKLFDAVIGILDTRKPMESRDSMDIDIFDHCDFIICNNGDLNDLKAKVKKLF